MPWLLLLLCAALSGRLVAAGAEDWPQFRGPDGQGHSSEQGLPLEWSEQKNVAWKVPVAGRGWSSPVVAAGYVWLTTAVTMGRETSLRLMAFEVASGRTTLDLEVFRFRGVELLNAKNSHASPTPIVDGDRVYVHFGAAGTAAVSSTGTIVWKTKLAYESQHGNAGSPQLASALLISNCDGFDQRYGLAPDTRTGNAKGP